MTFIMMIANPITTRMSQRDRRTAALSVSIPCVFNRYSIPPDGVFWSARLFVKRFRLCDFGRYGRFPAWCPSKELVEQRAEDIGDQAPEMVGEATGAIGMLAEEIEVGGPLLSAVGMFQPPLRDQPLQDLEAQLLG